jgi:hypothetical protein
VNEYGDEFDNEELSTEIRFVFSSSLQRINQNLAKSECTKVYNKVLRTVKGSRFFTPNG